MLLCPVIYAARALFFALQRSFRTKVVQVRWSLTGFLLFLTAFLGFIILTVFCAVSAGIGHAAWVMLGRVCVCCLARRFNV